MTTHALVLGGGGIAGIAWETGLLVGLAEAGIDIRHADLFVETSAGANVSAQMTSGLALDELFQRQVNPALQAHEPASQPDFEKMLAECTRAFKEGGTASEILQRIGALALAVPTVPEAQRWEVIVSRLPVHSWPQSRLEIVAVDVQSGERAIFTRDSGVELVDAVMASSALPYAWPPATINQRRYIVSLTWKTWMSRERLQREGAQIEVITLDEARIWRRSCILAAPGRDRVMVPGRGAARYQSLAASGNRRANGASAPKQLGSPPSPLTQGPVLRREWLHPGSPAKVPLEELTKQWSASQWQRFRLLEGHKGPLVKG